MGNKLREYLGRRKFAAECNKYNRAHPKQKFIAVVSCDEWQNRIYDDRLVVKALQRNGFRAKIISWQDSTVKYSDFDGLFIASMWGYQDHLPELERWFKKVGNKPIFNSLDVIRNNYDKVCQIELLKKHHVPIIPTKIIPVGTTELTRVIHDCARSFSSDSVVVKPSISGSGHNTYIIGPSNRCRSFDYDQIPEAFAKIIQEQPLLVQPFVKEIDNGELAAIYIGGEKSHYILRYPKIFNNSGSEHEVSIKNNAELDAICEKILSIPEYRDETYARIDFVKIQGKYTVMEVEMFEPQLFYHLTQNQDAILDKLVATIKEKLK